MADGAPQVFNGPGRSSSGTQRGEISLRNEVKQLLFYPADSTGLIFNSRRGFHAGTEVETWFRSSI